MIRVPSISIHGPWPALRSRGHVKSTTDALDRAERELARKRLSAIAERERHTAFSASIDGRPFF